MNVLYLEVKISFIGTSTALQSRFFLNIPIVSVCMNVFKGLLSEGFIVEYRQFIYRIICPVECHSQKSWEG